MSLLSRLMERPSENQEEGAGARDKNKICSIKNRIRFAVLFMCQPAQRCLEDDDNNKYNNNNNKQIDSSLAHESIKRPHCAGIVLASSFYPRLLFYMSIMCRSVSSHPGILRKIKKRLKI